MIRRLHVEQIRLGELALSKSESHHARDVLRLTQGASVELFDDAGRCATGSITQLDSKLAIVQVDKISTSIPSAPITVASAIPKGERADWMIEKLSEVGVSRFIPLITQRSVVEPKGKNKLDRWRRIAIESAKQSRRIGVMLIDEPMPLAEAIKSIPHALVLSTAADATPIVEHKFDRSIALFIGPEGGWTDAELAAFKTCKFASVKLTDTILRVETAALAAAAIVSASLSKR